MPCYHYALVRNMLGYLAAAVCGLAITSAAASAQQSGPRSTPSGPPDHFKEMRERRLREQQLRSVDMRLREKPKESEPAPTLEQADQDFRRILVLRNELARNISTAATLDYKLTSEAAAEINKRANRLKKFLVQPAREAEAEDERDRVGLNAQQLRMAVVVLCERIESFVENPLFKQAGVVDVRASARAGEDLLRIIKLSDGIRRDAVRLGKAVE